MGLITTAYNSFTSTLADQWKEYFVCPALDNDTLMIEGERKGKKKKQEKIKRKNKTSNVVIRYRAPKI